jgi:hypothetical protein
VLQANDAVIIGRPTPDLRQIAERGRRIGALVLRPLLASAIAARVSALVALERRVHQSLSSRQLGSIAITDALVAPTAAEVVVDSMTAPFHVVDPGSRPLAEVAPGLAELYLSALLAGETGM